MAKRVKDDHPDSDHDSAGENDDEDIGSANRGQPQSQFKELSSHICTLQQMSKIPDWTLPIQDDSEDDEIPITRKMRKDIEHYGSRLYPFGCCDKEGNLNSHSGLTEGLKEEMIKNSIELF